MIKKTITKDDFKTRLLKYLKSENIDYTESLERIILSPQLTSEDSEDSELVFIFKFNYPIVVLRNKIDKQVIKEISLDIKAPFFKTELNDSILETNEAIIKLRGVGDIKDFIKIRGE